MDNQLKKKPGGNRAFVEALRLDRRAPRKEVTMRQEIRSDTKPVKTAQTVLQAITT